MPSMVHTLWNCPEPFNLLSGTNWQRYQCNVLYIVFSIFHNLPYILSLSSLSSHHKPRH
uniref:Uncharacterized protein n=1 Tax=Arundo donax TaxID=35708 RepID=A0A0A8YI36_ARUDO